MQEILIATLVVGVVGLLLVLGRDADKTVYRNRLYTDQWKNYGNGRDESVFERQSQLPCGI